MPAVRFIAALLIGHGHRRMNYPFLSSLFSSQCDYLTKNYGIRSASVKAPIASKFTKEAEEKDIHCFE
jgi:hypothetical protein